MSIDYFIEKKEQVDIPLQKLLEAQGDAMNVLLGKHGLNLQDAITALTIAIMGIAYIGKVDIGLILHDMESQSVQLQDFIKLNTQERENV